MLRYAMTTAALKTFSLSPQTKHAYRLLGNRFGQSRRMHTAMSEKAIERAQRIIAVTDRYQVIHPGDRLLEIGTGWVHWESLILALFNDVRVTLLDVWDNRQLGAFKRYVGELGAVIPERFNLDPARMSRALRLVDEIAKAETFEEIYQSLGFEYVISPDGTLSQFDSSVYQLIFSCNVLEHIQRETLPDFVRDFYRLLKPGGYSIHQIDLGDHLAYYDRSVCLKNYLRYSDPTWRRFFENDVQYFNRVQRNEWLNLYLQAGFEVIEAQSDATDISTIRISPQFAGLNADELACLTLRVVHRKAAQG